MNLLKLAAVLAVVPVLAISASGCAADASEEDEDEAIALPEGADEGTTATTSEALVAPTCIKTRLDDDGWTDDLWVTNTCARDYRLKIVLEDRRDSSCFTLRSGYRIHYTWQWPGSFDGIVRC